MNDNVYRKDIYNFISGSASNFMTYFPVFNNIKLFDANGICLKHFDFEFLYVGDPSTHHMNARMILDKLQQVSPQPLTYSFSYKPITVSNMSERRYDADRWGFYNSQNRLTGFTPFPSNGGCGTSVQNSLIIKDPTNGFIDGAERNPNGTSAQEGILGQIIYPTGAIVKYEFEGNDYYDGTSNKNWGGLRIHSVTKKSSTTDPNPLLTEYSYINSQTPTESSGTVQYFGSGQPFRKQFDVAPYYKENGGYQGTYSLRYSNGNRETPPDIIRYSNVEVKTLGFGKTGYEFTNFNDHGDDLYTERKSYVCDGNGISSGTTYNSDIDNDAGAPFNDRSYERGLLKKITRYKENGGSFIKVGETENIYEFNGGTPNDIKGVRINCNKKFYEPGTAFHMFSYLPVTFNVEYYSMTSRWVYLKQVTTKTYGELSDGTVTSVPIQNDTYYYYDNPDHKQVTRVKWYDSDNTEYTLKTKYPRDYSYSGTTYDPEAFALNSLIDKHIDNAVVESITYMKKPSGNTVTIGATLNKYGLYGEFPQSVNSAIHYPQQLWKLELSSPLTTFSESQINSGSFSADSHYGYVQSNYYKQNGEHFASTEYGEFTNSTIRSHNTGNITATFDHAIYQPLELGNECSYIGFEEATYNTGNVKQPSDDNWIFDPTLIYSTVQLPLVIGNPHTGNSCLRVNSKKYTTDPTVYSTSKKFQPLHQDWKYKFSGWVNSQFQFAGAIIVTCIMHEDGSLIYNSNSDLLGWSKTDLDFGQGNLNSWKYYENEVDLKKFHDENSSYVGANEKLQVSCYFANTNVDYNLIWCFYIDDVSFQPSHSGKTFLSYNTQGFISSAIDSRNQISRMEYDSYNNLSSITDANGNVLSNSITHNRDINNPNDHSYIKTIVPNIATSLSNIGTLSDTEKSMSIIYKDGFGRPEQSIGIKQSPSGNDVVSFHKYDNTGRDPIKYLPYVSQFNDGNFQVDAIIDQANFYQPGNSNIHAVSDFPFAETRFDNSPFNRVLEQGGIDDVFQIGGGHTTNVSYVMNFDMNEIPEFTVTSNGASAMSGNSIAHYPLYSLHKLKSVDEEEKEVRSYTNKNGKVICKRVMACTESGNDETEDFTALGAPNCQQEDYYTFYIYNDLGQMCYEMPMAAYRYLQNSGMLSFTENDPVFTKWIFAYKYDERGRVIETYVPGKGRTCTVYNKFNQPVLTQSESQRINHDWTFVKYDYKGRIVYTGIYRDNRTRSAIQSAFNQFNGYFWETKGIYGNGFPIYGYSNTSIPIINQGGTDEVYTIKYYDNYDFDIQNRNYVSTISVDKSEKTFGLLTGTFVKVLASNPTQRLLSVNYYDSKARLIQQHQQNHLGGWDIFDNLFQFDGRLLKSYRNHTIANTIVPVEVNIRNEYDDGGRLSGVFEKIDHDPEILLCGYVYNELGQVIQKDLHYDASNATYLQMVDYRYNIKGWLTSINNATLSNDGGITNGDDYDAFGEEIYYYGERVQELQGRVTVLPDIKPIEFYDGKIAATIWKSQVPGAAQVRFQNVYSYRYDDFNRMTCAHYVRENDIQNGIFDTQAGRYDEMLHYNLNGNITKLHRNSKAGTIDDLTYTYLNDGNQLDRVDDNPASAQLHSDFHDGASASGEYHYDVNGSIIQDDNKGIATTYNYLSLPVTVTKGQDVITYTYDATGRKLTAASPSGIHDYVSGIEYENAHLQLITTQQGRVRPRTPKTLNITQYVYDYFIKDHVGNVRAIVTEEQTKDDYNGTLELQNASSEETIFENVAETRQTKPPGEPTNPNYSPDTKVSKLNASQGNSIGIAKTLQVNQGDAVDIDAKYYFDNLQLSNDTITVNNLLTTLANIFVFNTNSPAGTIAEAQQNWASSTFTGNQAVNDFLVNAFGSSVVNDPSKPQAFLVYLFFDKEFNFNPAVSGIIQVQNPNTLGDLAILNLKMPETGYLYIYTNNESNQDVNFNDMRIAHYKGRVIEEDHYYPYGMLIEPMSWSASAFTKNGYKYQDKNLQTQLDYYHEEFFFRHYDPALGRWNVADPMSQFFNPYIAMGDNPVSQVDPLGSWVHTGPSAGGMAANAQAEGMRNIQKQLTQMNYNAAMAAGTPGGGGMPFVMNRGGSYWLAPSQEQMDWMAISGSTVMANGNGQVFSINNQGELLLGHMEYSIHSYQIYGTEAFDFYDYTSTHLPAIGIDYSDGVQVYAKQEVTSETFITDFNLGNSNNYYPGPDMPSIPHNYAEGMHGGEITFNIAHVAAKQAWGEEINLITKGTKVLGRALGFVNIADKALKFIDNPSENWVDGVEALGQVIFIAAGGAEAELFYNVGVAVFDQIREH